MQKVKEWKPRFGDLKNIFPQRYIVIGSHIGNQPEVFTRSLVIG